jgi:predicted RNase H-like nuclease (RuvC/YqgF family)
MQRTIDRLVEEKDQMADELESKISDKQVTIERLEREAWDLKKDHEADMKDKDNMIKELRETIDRLVKESVAAQ